MEMTRERTSFTFDPRDMLLSLLMGFSFVRAAVACAILERTSDLEPSSETTGGCSGGALMLGKLPAPGRPTNLDYSRARAYCAYSRCG